MNLFKKLFSSQKSKPEDLNDDSFSCSKYMPEIETPVDELFMINFREKGGKFIYCQNLNEALEAFDSILLENDWYEKDTCCFENDLKQTFSTFNLKFGQNTKAPFYVSSCEYLIGNIGGILISSNQLKEKKLAELPENFIVVSYTSQLIRDISEGLKGIKKKHNNTIPSNITTIQHFGTQKESNFLSYGSSAKNLYLLLIEDL